MLHRMTTEQFIIKAKAIHGDKYEYSLVDYQGSTKKIIIICAFHGQFSQEANSHLQGHGCRICTTIKNTKIATKTTETFISEAKQLYGDTYDYSQTSYTNTKTKVIIICRKHGPFHQTPDDHLRKDNRCFGNGCSICRGIKIGKGKRKSIETFINEANIVHNYKYDYSESEYVNSDTHIKIICPIHGFFNQTPKMHVNGKQECLICGRERGDKARRYTTNEFIEKANKIHDNKYDYSLAIYNDASTKIIIICPKHGEFSQEPTNHLSGQGCKACVHMISKLETAWLNYLNIPEKYRQINLKVSFKKRKVSVDAYDPYTNTIYEFYGDYWHGNILLPKFGTNKIHPIIKKSFGELYNETLKREQLLKLDGYNLISIWEDDWNNFIKSQKIDQINSLI
jgi:hypothetical protein